MYDTEHQAVLNIITNRFVLISVCIDEPSLHIPGHPTWMSNATANPSCLRWPDQLSILCSTKTFQSLLLFGHQPLQPEVEIKQCNYTCAVVVVLVQKLMAWRCGKKYAYLYSEDISVDIQMYEV